MVSAGHRHSLRHRHHQLRFKLIHGRRKDDEYYCDYVLLGNRLVQQQAATSCGESSRNASLATSGRDESRTKRGQDEKTAMLCCGRKKDGHKEHPVEMAASPRRQGANAAASEAVPGSSAGPAPGNPSSHYQTTVGASAGGGGMHPLSSVAAGTLGIDHRLAPHSSPAAGLRSMVVQSDFRKVSGISTEIFRQIETVENDHNDATTAAALEAVERRGEMLVRVLDPRQMGRAASEAARSFLTVQDPKYSVHFVEIVKRPGQTLGLYIREGNGIDRSDGVFISRIALESSVYNSGCLRVGDEILAINLVDVTRMSLDDVVIVMSIPRRLVLTTRQRRGPAGAVSPPPPRPEQKPPPVVVLKRGVQPEEPPDNDSTSNSNSNNGDRFQQYPYSGGLGPSRFLTTGKPLPGMADLPIHGTFPRGNRERTEQQQRDLFREREAGRYPERAGDDIHSSIRQQQQQQQQHQHQHQDAMENYYSNYRMQEQQEQQQQQLQQQQQQQQRYVPGRQGGTLERPQHPKIGGGSGGGEGMTHQIDSYHPPPPLPVTEQPKPGMSNINSSSTTSTHHFQHPFDRSAGFGPKTLESLAERVHPFYGLSIGPPGSGPGSMGQHQSATLGRSSTLGRSHRVVGSGPGSTMSLMRGTGTRLTRSGSDQRLPVVEQSSGTDTYGYARGKLGVAGSGSNYGTTGRTQQQPDAATRLGLTHRRRTSVDYASDTEASIRSYSHSARRGFSVEGSSGSWKAPPPLLGLGITPTTPTAGGFQPTQPDSRSNSLPRDRGGSGPANSSNRFRREVHFEQTSSSMTRPSVSSMLDNTDDSDGAVSAPEMTVSQKQKQLQRLSQQQQHLQQQQLLYSRGILPGAAAPLSRLPGGGGIGMTGNFTAAEYKAWMQRAPSTSAIYERLRQSRDAIEAHRMAKLTFSAENLVEKAKQEIPYYAYRSHFTATTNVGLLDENDPMATASSLLSQGGKSLLPGRSGPSGPVAELQPETPRGSIPQPSPANPNATRPTDPRFKLLEINPADFIKYRSERPNGTTPPAHQMATTNTGGMTTPTATTGGGPGPAPGGGSEEGVSGLLWIHLMAGRGLRSTSSRLEPVRDLYCVLECDRAHKARTVIRSGDINFDWDETFDLDLVVNRELDFLIYSWDPQLRHRLCFKGSLHLVPLVRESTIHQVALKVEPRGTLYLKLRYTEPRTAFRRSPAGRKTPPPLFGVDLESVVNREGGNNGSAASMLTGGNGGVPIIVQKCVEEVERRGMDIVGLYRLCGSATKKRILREAFERNPRLVDLSPDSVPDINVITGLLKEYLRELPEPLLTKCLYQMLVDALAVCLPDDPEGNAKLMFSILECLPKGNRTTLFLLMDHLCLVTAQSDRNKMTPQNLAICFGPVLMLHSEDGSNLSSASTGLDFQKPIGVLKYLLQIWPMKSARAVEAAATASSTLRRIQQQQLQLQQRTASGAAPQHPQQQQQPHQPPQVPSVATSDPPTPSTSSTASTSSSIIINNNNTSAAVASVASVAQVGPTINSVHLLSTGHRVADRRLDLPPLPPRPAPKVLQPRAAGGAGGVRDAIARGEADGSPAPLSTDSAAGAGSETPSLTSPTSTTSTTTSLSPVQHQQHQMSRAEAQRGRTGLPRKDLDSEDELESNRPTMGGARMLSHKDDPSAGAGFVTADDTDQGESDLESPN